LAAIELAETKTATLKNLDKHLSNLSEALNMYYLDREELSRSGRSTPWFSVSLPATLIILFVLSFLPGMPKGGIAGHEFGTSAMVMPLRGPLSRPVYLKAGETLRIHYGAIARAGSLSLNVHYGRDFMSMITAEAQTPALALTVSQSGTTTFTARRTGYYFFWSSIRATGGYRRECQQPLTAFWYAARGNPTDCSTYNISYHLSWI
jgi:hypothetical protein